MRPPRLPGDELAITSSGVRLFTWVQGATFYCDVHRQAVELLPPGNGQSWLDAGCGPGLVSRLAAARGYRVLGVDSDERMIKAARRLARRIGSSARFEVRTVFELASASADIVSACSLIAVLDEKERALRALWSSVKPGGSLLIVEPTDRMRPENAKPLLERGLPAKRVHALVMWATARQGRAVSPSVFDTICGAAVERTVLLDGLVDAWIFRKPAC